MSNRYEKIKRHDLKDSIEREYGVQIKNMHEGDRGILLYTDKETMMIRRLKKEDSKILFAASAYEHAVKNGFENLSYIHRTISGKYFFEYNGEAYILQHYTSGCMFAVKTPEDAACAGRALAMLHKACEGFIPASGSRARVDWGKWMEKFKAQALYIKKYMELAEAKEEPGKFDKAFIRYAGTYHERMYSAYLMLKKHNYMGKVHESMNTNQLTHKELKRHSLLKSDQGDFFITDMENCGYDIREVDIATLLESLSVKNREVLAAEIIRAYSEIIPLDYDSLKIIQAFLVEPKRFFKVVQKYYGRKNNSTENELIVKLERSLKKESKKDELIIFLEDFSL